MPPLCLILKMSTTQRAWHFWRWCSVEPRRWESSTICTTRLTGVPMTTPNLLSKAGHCRSPVGGHTDRITALGVLAVGIRTAPGSRSIRFFESARSFSTTWKLSGKSILPMQRGAIGRGTPQPSRCTSRQLKEIAAWGRERKLPLHIARGGATW